MEEIDYDGIEYIYCIPKLNNIWHYSINTIKEHSVIKQDDLVKLLTKIGVFNKDKLTQVFEYHQSFLYIHEKNEIKPLMFGENLSEDEIYDLVWNQKEKPKSICDKFKQLFENSHKEKEIYFNDSN